MAGITLEQAQQKLDQYLMAETAVLGGQSYHIAGRRLDRANLQEIQNGIEIWDRRVKSLSIQRSGRGRTRTVVVGG